MRISSSGRQPFDITAAVALEVGCFAALGVTLVSLILTVIRELVSMVIALIHGCS